jgi:porin
MKWMAFILIIMASLMGIGFNTLSWAEEGQYSGDFWTRQTMTGDWGGTRNEWAAKGVTFDINLTQTGMSVVSGGKHQGWEYSGRGDLTLKMDTQKLGLWPGGFFTVEVEGNYNKSINLDTGSLSAVNTSQLFPTTGKDQLNIPAVSFTQFLSHYFGVFVGKVATVTAETGDMNEFAHGKGDTQFFNFAFNLNPTILVTVPYSTLAGGVIILPTKDPNEAIITLNALDGDGEANRSGFDTVFEGNTAYVVEGRVRTGFFGMTGHQLLGATYSTKNFTSLSQDLRLIIQTLPLKEEDNSWCIYYNFDQFLYEPQKGRGIGLFGRFGASDGDANPVHYFYSIGVGSKGLITSRPNDNFGIGYYYIDVSSLTFTGILRNFDLLRDEYGVEAYYNIAITPWMKLTPDIQFVRPAQKHEYNTENGILNITRKGIETATVLGLRLQMIF